MSALKLTTNEEVQRMEIEANLLVYADFKRK